MALEVTNAQYGILRLLDKDGATLLTQAVAGADLGHPYVQALPMNEPSISAWVMRNRQPVLIPDLTAEPWSEIYFPLDANLKMQSELAVPLISASGRMLGVLNLESPLKNAFSDDDRLLLQSFATQAVIAVQEARLLDAFQEIPQMLLTQTEDQVLDRLTELACNLVNAPASAIWLFDGDEADCALLPGPASAVRACQVNAEPFLTVLQENKVYLFERHLSNTTSKIGPENSPDWQYAWLSPFTAGPAKENRPACFAFT